MPHKVRRGVYVQGVKTSVDILRTLAVAAPFPCVHLALSAVTALIAVGERINANKELRNELNSRACALLLVMIAPLKGKAQEEIPPGLQSDIEQLISQLQIIIHEMQEIANQTFFWQLFSKDDNAAIIEGCSRRLDASMAKFDVSRKIQDALSLSELGSDVKGIEQKVGEIHERIVAQPVIPAISLPPLSMPSKPRCFFGRDSVVDALAKRLTVSESKSARVAVLGPGGMGKTSVALAVVEHPDVTAKFATHCRFWVPCVEATSPSRLLDILTASLRVTQSTSDRLNDILSELKAAPQARLLLLDNFETPWDLQNQRSEVESILCALAKVPQLSLLLTMRSYYPPSDEIDWDSESLAALEEEAAHQIYKRINPDAESDPALDELLSELDGLPLAITLMARLASNSGSKPNELLEAWRNPDIRTDLLTTDGLDAKSNINVSIRLSLQSNLVKRSPCALTLLAILSMLPGGARRDFIRKLAPSISNVSRALAILSQSSLAEQRRASHTVHVQPVIRSYMQRYHPLSAEVRQGVYDAYCEYVKAHKSEPGDPKFDEDARALTIEETNIHAVLLEAAEQGSLDALDALLTFSWHQHWVRPRVETIEHTVQIARRGDDIRRVAEALNCQGAMYFELDRFDDAYTSLTEARTIMQRLGDSPGETDCLLKLGEIQRWRNRTEESRIALEEANKRYLALNDARGVAESLLNLGALHWKCGRIAEATAALEESQKGFSRICHPQGAAHCLLQLSQVYLSERRYSMAHETALEARSECQRLAYRDGAAMCLTLLGTAELAESRYPEALERFEQGLQEYQQLGGPLGVAQCLHGLGLAYRRLSQYEQAATYLLASRERHLLVHSFLGNAGAAECLEALGNAHYLESDLDQACAAFEQAGLEYRLLGHGVSSNRCLHRLDQIWTERLDQTWTEQQSLKEWRTAEPFTILEPFVGHLLRGS